tara:strand:- start:4637 stop:6595 length:1959 start_codon:yes stop_codon:yes gene_type:complete
MKKSILLSLVFILFLVNLVYAAGDVTIDPITTVSVNPSATATFSVVVNNTGSSSISSVTLTSTALSCTTGTCSGESITAPTITTLTDISASSSKTRNFTISTPIKLTGSYIGNVTATDASNSSNTDTISYTLVINSIDDLDVLTYSNSTPLTITSEDDETKTATFDVKNIGSTSFGITTSEITFTSSDFEDNDGDNITLSFSGLDSSVTPDTTDTVTITADIPNKMDLGTYDGTINVQDSTGANDTFKLEVKIQPEICEDGIVRDGDSTTKSQAFLQIDVNEPDDGDEFKPGETIDVEVDVENEDDDQLDVIVEVLLYNLDEGDKIVSEKSSSVEIDDDDSEDFTISLKVPEDANLDENDEYIIYVKAYESGDEDENCNEEEVELDLEKDDHDVVVEDISLSPSSVICGGSVTVTVDLENLGSSNEDDTFVEVRNTLLSLTQKTAEFDLDEEDDDTKRLTFTVPTNIKSGTYDVEAIVTFDDEDEENSNFATLTVTCGDEVETTNGGTTETSAVTLNVGEVSTKEDTFSVPLEITNNGNTKATYTIEVANVGDWANSVSDKTLTLNAGQKGTVFVFLEAQDDASGKRSATVNIKENNNVVTSKSLTFDLGETSGSGFDLGGIGSNTIFWIIVDILAILVVLYVIKIIFIPKK